MTFKITVRFFTTLREITGKREEQIEFRRSPTVGLLLKKLSNKYGKEFNDYIYDQWGGMRSQLHFLVNGQNVECLQGLRTRLKEDDQVTILPPVGGG